MLFNSYIFILVFLPIFLLVYFTINAFEKYKLADYYLIGMSMVFYGYINIYYLLLLLASVFINYIVSCCLFESIKQKKTWLIAGIVVNVTTLIYLKYVNFFIDNINSVFGKDIAFKNIFIPIGISFFTFTQISFLVDCYKDNYKCELTQYVSYIMFFPKILQGPIVYRDEYVSQINDISRRKVNYANLNTGLYRFSLGLAKKVLLADTFALFADACFSNIESINQIEAIYGMLFYTLQLYFDFSGYTDMALAVAKMINIELPDNFNSPYKAKNIAEFWDRWHTTLTRFFTKYIYIPLGGSRKGTARTYINILFVFFISGIWHGAGWNFIVWGLMHGVAMVFYRLIKKYYDKIPGAIGRFITFSYVNICWVFFRADSFKDAMNYCKRIFLADFSYSLNVFEDAIDAIDEVAIVTRMISTFQNGMAMNVIITIILVVALMIVFATKKVTDRKVKPYVTVILLVWSILSLSGVSRFVYFDF